MPSSSPPDQFSRVQDAPTRVPSTSNVERTSHSSSDKEKEELKQPDSVEEDDEYENFKSDDDEIVESPYTTSKSISSPPHATSSNRNQPKSNTSTINQPQKQNSTSTPKHLPTGIKVDLHSIARKPTHQLEENFHESSSVDWRAYLARDRELRAPLLEKKKNEYMNKKGLTPVEKSLDVDEEKKVGSNPKIGDLDGLTVMWDGLEVQGMGGMKVG
jgi:hypothetical protein